MLTRSEKTGLEIKYRALIDAVKAGKALTAGERDRLQETYRSVLRQVMAEKAGGWQGELLGGLILLAKALGPGAPGEDVIEKVISTPSVKVALRCDSQTCYFQFEEPPREEWSKQNCEFLVGVETGLRAPFDKVFVKRMIGRRVLGHDLLLKLTGRTLPFSPTFLGYAEGTSGRHLYFFQNLAPGFVTLESELNDISVICPEIVNSVVRKAAELFKVIVQFGFVYKDFSAKNIMVKRGTGELAVIDVDSAWPQALLKTTRDLTAEGQNEFWGLWNHYLRGAQRVRLENAHKSILLSFAAVWGKAVALKRSGKRDDYLAALTLVYNPGYDQQRMLWDSLASQNKEDFFTYFKQDGAGPAAVYAQWQAVFDAFILGQEVTWQEIVSATKNLLAAVGRNASAQNCILVGS